MNLQSEISVELWDVVGKSYEAANYTNAINDAIRYLFDMIRDKSGVEADGAGLVGEAFGGSTPKLQLNKLQTESEKMEQKGFQEILRGIYSGIRNPRSHERRIDSQETADAIIIFVNYLLGVIDRAKPPFTVEEWIDRVYDPYFVKSRDYIEALVGEIPVRKRFDTLLTLYYQRHHLDIGVMRYVFAGLYRILEEAQIKEFLRIISNELKNIIDKNDITIHLTILRAEFWLGLDKVAKLRMEGILLQDIESGTYMWEDDDAYGGSYVCTSGSLGTWAVKHTPYWLNKYQLSWKLLEKIKSSFEPSKDYVAEYFFLALPKIVEESEIEVFIDGICDAVVDSVGHCLLAKKITKDFYQLPPTWQKTIQEKLLEKDSEVYTNMFAISDEDIPF